eukprot:9327505-Ditylum_brightwellii.AAC.1
MRGAVMETRSHGHTHHLIIGALQQLHKWPCLKAGRRQQARLQLQFGHYGPYKRTGNAWAEVLQDHNLMFLALYRAVFSKCTAPEINAFLYQVNYGNLSFHFYSSSQISEAEKRLGFTRVAVSTTTYQAYLQIFYTQIYLIWMNAVFLLRLVHKCMENAMLGEG